VAEKIGWQGRFYEDFEVGDVYPHQLGRTLLSADNAWFTLLQGAPSPVHFDHHYASQTEFGRPLVNSVLTLAVVMGQSVSDLSQNVFGNLGWDEIRLPAPVFEGDTLYSQSEVLEKRLSKSRESVGIVRVSTVGFNQDGTVVITFRRTIMLYRRGFQPKLPKPKLAEKQAG
jgi:acyl dehydratase